MDYERIVCYTPASGSKPTSIHLWKYLVVRDALLRTVPKNDPGIEAQRLPEIVGETLGPQDKKELGSLTWYTTTVRLHMEVEGELIRVPKSKPLRLIRA